MRECYCPVDGEPPDWFTERKVKARKKHICCECEDEIKIGETHLISVRKWEGKVEQYRTCLSCEEIRKGLTYSPPFGSLGCCYLQELYEDSATKISQDKIEVGKNSAL